MFRVFIFIILILCFNECSFGQRNALSLGYGFIHKSTKSLSYNQAISNYYTFSLEYQRIMNVKQGLAFVPFSGIDNITIGVPVKSSIVTYKNEGVSLNYGPYLGAILKKHISIPKNNKSLFAVAVGYSLHYNILSQYYREDNTKVFNNLSKVSRATYRNTFSDLNNSRYTSITESEIYTNDRHFYGLFNMGIEYSYSLKSNRTLTLGSMVRFYPKTRYVVDINHVNNPVSNDSFDYSDRVSFSGGYYRFYISYSWSKSKSKNRKI
jgi:hypothetical protein